jgi:cold shock protein
LGSSTHLDGVQLGNWAAKIATARKLYGADSAYVIGMITALEWLCDESVEGAEAKALLHQKILEASREQGPTTVNAAPALPKRASSESAESNEDLVENSWVTGVVKWFNNDKGYGFISTDGNTDVFVHWRDISTWDRSLAQGDAVEFMVTRTAKGFQAINVMKPGEGSEEGPQEGGDGTKENAEVGTENDSAPDENATGKSEDIGTPSADLSDTEGGELEDKEEH